MAATLNSAILDSTILHKKNFTYLFWLNLMMAAILNSAILNSAILDSAILHKTLTQTNLIWLKLIHSNLTWWWQPILNSAILDSTILHKKKTSLIYSDSTWWWQPSWILPSWILPSWIHPFCTKILPLFILNQPDDGSNLEFYHLGFPAILHKITLTHSFWLNLMITAIL